MFNARKSALVIAALLTLAAPALAQTSSNQTDYDNAILSLSAAGTYAKAVSFSVPSTTVTLKAEQIRPGNSFTLSIPVTNTTDRDIDVSAVAKTPTGTGAANLTVSGVSPTATIMPGEDATLTFTLTFDSSTDEAQAGQTVQVVFDVSATASANNTSSSDSSF
ncbi:hypothetical protein DVJ83_01870 [Deinococcus wulumuqiensis]|uniref:DUF11 domain-containing protein n=1 Tax=Deinococcus wulumuqiensis TaxID=980427 RepID=A0A345IEJ3_9DEIO|nr:hypothetical protein [Deinococcus wulumuqiensis]AXG98115.1 hypothetical protein DVJ83_01870 [Deinococcus wulumuqiensis]